MPNITLEIRRIPKPGKEFEVIREVIKALKNVNRAGLVSNSAMASHASERDIVSGVRFSGWDELEEIHDHLMSNEDFQKHQSSIEELCSKTTIQALNILAPGDINSGTKYMRRTFLKAKRGESGGLSDSLLAWHEVFPSGKKPIVQKQAAGDIDIVRITSGFESLKSMMESASDIATNPDYSRFRTQVSNLTQNVMSWNYRVVHINQV